MWIQLYEDVQPVFSGSQEVLKFGFLKCSGFNCGLAVLVRWPEGRPVLCWGTLGPKAQQGFCLGSTVGRVGLGWEHTKSLLLETPCKASEADNDFRVLHQMIIVLKKTFSVLFQVVVCKFWFLTNSTSSGSGSMLKSRIKKKKNLVLLNSDKSKALEVVAFLRACCKDK